MVGYPWLEMTPMIVFFIHDKDTAIDFIDTKQVSFGKWEGKEMDLLLRDAVTRQIYKSDSIYSDRIKKERRLFGMIVVE